MEKVLQIQQLLLRSRRLTVLVLGLTLAILAGVVLFSTLQLRDRTRTQIAGRDAEVIHAVALMHADAPDVQWLGSIRDPANQLAVLLKTSELKVVHREASEPVVRWRVLAARLFDAHGAFVEAFPANVTEDRLAPADLDRLRRLEPVSRYHPAAALDRLFLSTETAAAPARPPMLEVNVPLHTSDDPALAGVAQFLIEGTSVAGEFARLDRNLLGQALAAFLVAGALLTLAITWAFRRLHHSGRLLAERTENLLRANQELALAAKTSALGAVTAHLLHGLKNPLSGLQNFVASRGAATEGVPADWQEAAASTRRMQGMINQVVNILREDRGGGRYELSTAELLELICSQTSAVAERTGVRLLTEAGCAVNWPNRTANLLTLILVNLVQNALEATPRGGQALLRIHRRDGLVLWEVRDQGPGFPEGLPPFSPCSSSKEGGSGIGLALCKQLANHLGATLQLQHSSPAGCLFVLSLPARLGLEKSERATSPSLG